MNLVDLIAIILATYRLSSLLVDEAGPFGIFLRLRELFGIKHDVGGDIICIPDNFLAKLCSCLWCVSIWMAGLSYLIWWLEPIPIYILAASGGAILIDNVRSRNGDL